MLAIASTPTAGRRLSVARIEKALRAAGRQRYITASAQRIHAALQAPQLTAQEGVETAYGASTSALVAVIAELTRQIAALAGQVSAHFGQHLDAEIYSSQPGLGPVLAARVLAEFGDDPHRYADAKARRNYAGTSPITRPSGKSRAVLARHVRNRLGAPPARGGLADALYAQALSALSASPGARAYYDTRRAAGATHHQALRALGNRLVGVLHGCLRHHHPYQEATAWATTQPAPLSTAA